MTTKSFLNGLASLIILPFLATACNNGGSGGTTGASQTPNNSTAPTTLPDGSAMTEDQLNFAANIQGSWENPCHKANSNSTYYSIVIIKFSGWNFTSDETIFDDSQCVQNKIAKFMSEIPLTNLTKLAGEETYQIQATSSNSYLTPLADTVATDWNTRNVCGFNDWSNETKKTLAATFSCQVGPAIFDSRGKGVAGYEAPVVLNLSESPNSIKIGIRTFTRQ